MAPDASGAAVDRYGTTGVISVSHRTLTGQRPHMHDVTDVELVTFPVLVDHDESSRGIDVDGLPE